MDGTIFDSKGRRIAMVVGASISTSTVTSSMTSKALTSTSSPANWSVTSLWTPAVPKDLWTNRLTSFFVKTPGRKDLS
jgi:hypothetical protein